MRGKKDVMPITELIRARVTELGDGGQKALADFMGVSEATASRWVNGSVPEEKRAPKFARWLGQPQGQVLASIALARKQRQEEKTQAQRSAAVAESDEVRQLRETVEELTTRVQGLERKLSAAERRRPAPRAEPGSARNTN